MEDKDIKLDNAALELFKEFEGIDSSNRNEASNARDRLGENLVEEQKRLDTWRMLLIDAADLISAYFFDDQFLNNQDSETETYIKLVHTFEELKKMEQSSDSILIRFRGVPTTGDTPDDLDYEIIYGNIVVDTGIIPSIIRRLGMKVSHISEKLMGAFIIFSKIGFNNLLVRFPQKADTELDHLRSSLHILARFKTAQENNLPLTISFKGKEKSIPIIKDEQKRPDANLTIMSGISNLKPQTTETLINKVNKWMEQKRSSESGCPYSSVYNAIFGIKKLDPQIIKPYVEVNNAIWLMMMDAEEEVDKPDSKEKVNLIRFVVDDNYSSPQKAAKVLNSVYGNDFQKIDSKRLGDRINLSSELLTSIEKKPESEKIEKEVLSNIDVRLDKVNDDVYDDLDISGSQSDDNTENKGGKVVHEKLDKMLTYYKGRSVIRKKMKRMVRKPINFSEEDYTTIARDFSVKISEAKELIVMLKSCFSDLGRFSKGKFISIIQNLTKYEKKIFEFLWHHLKDAIDTKDRVPFLNSLQLLASRLEQPKRAFKTLLEDFSSDPSTVNYSDNKAIMLSNLIIHRYDDELADMEMTPEDILADNRLLNEAVGNYASWRIDKDREKIFDKIQTIHEALRETLSSEEDTADQISAKDLLSLEREFYIFLSLLKCKTGNALLRSAAYEYGNPDSNIYLLNRSPKHMSTIIQNLRIIIRGLGRIGSVEDVHCLNEVKRNESKFLTFVNTKTHKEQIRIINERINEAIDTINSRS